jgi:hypothetical protein
MKFMGKILKKRESKGPVVNFAKCSIFRKKHLTFPEFGKEVHRPYPVHEYCYDCKKFIEGCNGWNPRKRFQCVKAKWYGKVEAG